jgi:hypothetical protein
MATDDMSGAKEAAGMVGITMVDPRNDSSGQFHISGKTS